MTINEQIKSKNIEKASDVNKIVNSLRAEGMTDGSIREFLLECGRKFELGDNLFERSLDYLLSISQPVVEEVELFKVGSSESTALSCVEDVSVRKLLSVLLYVAKTNWHHTGWIKYDEVAVMELCKMKNHSRFLEEVQKATKQGLSFRVVGSKNPILCFKLDFIDPDIEQDVFAVDYSLSELLKFLGIND